MCNVLVTVCDGFLVVEKSVVYLHKLPMCYCHNLKTFY